MNKFILKINAHKEKLIYYTDTDSIYVKANIFNEHLKDVEDDLEGGKNDYGKTEGIVYA
tara:strand:- start:7 stop:183 length:177 start_codon:yes stop_codon:yes gene_type:complete